MSIFATNFTFQYGFFKYDRIFLTYAMEGPQGKECNYRELIKIGLFEPCPRCKHRSYEVLDGFAYITLHPEPLEFDEIKIINVPK